MSTYYLSLQVIDILGIIRIDAVFQTAWNLFYAEPGGAAQPAVPTGAAGLRAALRGLGDGLDLEPDSSTGASAQLDFRLPGVSPHEATGGSAQLCAVHLRGDAAVAALQRNRAA